tara:strand:+ start:2343 stop:3386 length:1044 start_codon:yes stop_codon:yes gene_type:complete
MDFFDKIAKEVGEDYITHVDSIKEHETFVDTGSYIFNALVSGSIFGGVSGNRITAIAGETSTGKTYFATAVVKNFLVQNPKGAVFYFDTENAIEKNMLVSRGITGRFYKVDVATVEEFRHQAYKILDNYMKEPEEDRRPMMFVLDSLGMMSTTKETEDTLNDKQVRDMTKSQLIKGTFRILTSKLAKADVPMIVTNHTYDVVGAYVPTKEMGGGSGLKYAASTIIHLSKSKEKDGKEIIGNIIKAKTNKSRLSKENQQVEIRLFYDERGLDNYYGLPQLALKYGIFEKAGSYLKMPDGKKVYEKTVLGEPEKYFTDDVMRQLDAAANLEFTYGGREDTSDDSEESST